MLETDMIDILMVTHNRLDFTNQTLKHLMDNTKTPYRLIIVDNGSTDGTRDMLSAIPENHKVILLPDNKGLEVAKNIGLEHVKSELFVDTDNDILVPFLHPDWLAQLEGLMKEHPEFAAIALRPQILVGVGALFAKDGEVVENNVCGGSMRMMRTQAVRDSGAWRDRFTNDSEEWEICGKLKKNGWKVGYAKYLWCYHLFGDDHKWGYGGGQDRRHGDRTCVYVDSMFEVDPDTKEPKVKHNQ